MSYPSYPEYQESRTEWLGYFPSHWAEIRFKYLFTLQKRPVRSDDDIVTCFRDGEVTLRKNRRTEGFTNAVQETGYQGVRTGDLVIHAMDAFAGAIGVSDSDGKSSPVYSICTKNRKNIETTFYAYLLRYMALSGFIGSLAKGIRERSTDFRWSDACGLFVPLPPSEEQVQIAHFLDHQTARIDALIAEQQRLIELLKEKRQTVISHAVTKGLDPDVAMKDSGVQWLGQVPEHWEVVKLRWLARLNSGEGITTESIETEGEYPVYGGNGVRGYTEQFTHYGIHVLIGRQGALCGNINYADGRFWASEHAVVVTPTRDLDPVWLGETLRYMDLNQYSISAAQPGLAVDRVSGLQVPVPPKWEQSKIAEVLDEEIAKVRNLIDVAVQGIEILRERRSALISAAVTGKIDVRDWEPPVSETASHSTTSEETPA